VPAAGVPAKVPALLSVTPLAKAPLSVKVGAGTPVAVTVKLPAVPRVKVVLAALVMAGALSPASLTAWSSGRASGLP